jgi:hypothetical protein
MERLQHSLIYQKNSLPILYGMAGYFQHASVPTWRCSTTGEQLSVRTKICQTSPIPYLVFSRYQSGRKQAVIWITHLQFFWSIGVLLGKFGKTNAKSPPCRAGSWFTLI